MQIKISFLLEYPDKNNEFVKFTATRDVAPGENIPRVGELFTMDHPDVGGHKFEVASVEYKYDKSTNQSHAAIKAYEPIGE